MKKKAISKKEADSLLKKLGLEKNLQNGNIELPNVLYNPNRDSTIITSTQTNLYKTI